MSSTYKIRLSGVVPPITTNNTSTTKRSRCGVGKSIKGRGGGGGGGVPSRHVVEISPSTTLTELRTIALQSFGVSSPLPLTTTDGETPPITTTKTKKKTKTKTTKMEEEVYRTELWIGFPPKKLVVPGDTTTTTTTTTDNNDGDFDNGNRLLVKDFIKAGENVLVKFEKLVVGSSSSSSTSKQSNTTKPMSNNSTTSRKAKSSLINGDKGSQRTVSKKRPRATTITTTKKDNDKDNESNTTTDTQPSPTTPPKRPKRASAEAATASFPTAIRAQNKLLRAEQKQKQKQKQTIKPNTTHKPNTTTTTTKKQKAAAEARAAAALSRRLASLPGGRSLNDEPSNVPSDKNTTTTTNGGSTSLSSSSSRNNHTVVRPPRPSRPRLKKPLFGSSITSESDVSVTLLSSLSGNGNGGGTVGKFLRTAMRNAVGRTYEVSRAVVRNTAVSGGTVTFLPHEQRLGGGSGSGSSTDGGRGGGRSGAFVGIHTVRYPKGIEGRGYYEEEVDVIGLDALKAVIQAVHADHSDDDEGLGDTEGGGGGREMLRPQNMALLSPRVFWSLWFHFYHLPTSATTEPSSETTTTTTTTTPCTSIEEALVRLHPSLNWSFLTSRSRELSTKAKDNLRQKRERERGVVGMATMSDQKRHEEEFKESQRAIDAVEDAMAKCYQEDVDSARERAGRAALARFESLGKNNGADKKNDGEEEDDDNTVEWSLVTPDETDEDELRECISEGFESMDEGENNNNNIIDRNGEAIDGWVRLIVSRGSIHNWRELANADSTVLRSVLSRRTDPGVTTTTTTTIDVPLEIPSIEAIDTWIDAAQSRTVEEIMLEILDGNDDLFCLLRDEGPRAGTPKDLCLWLSIPSMLLEEVRTALGKRKSGGGGEGIGEEDELVVVESDVVRWCRRARTAVEKLQWLEDYITPI